MNNLTLSDFSFDLPNELIARNPTANRKESRLLHFDVEQQKFNDLNFPDIVKLIPENSVLVYNNTKVVPARCFARRLTGAKLEILVERATGEFRFLAHTRSNRSLKEGTIVIAGEDKQGSLELTTDQIDDLNNLSQKFIAHFGDDNQQGYLDEIITKINKSINNTNIGIFINVGRQGSLFDYVSLNRDIPVLDLLQKIGHIPLPPYMEREDEQNDQERYQTVYAKIPGAVAAPTAGLHFTPEILNDIRKKGVEILEVTLHVGAGTFLPVKVTNIKQHQMHAEWLQISSDTADKLNKALQENRKIICVGTTSVRSLETMVQHSIRKHIEANSVAELTSLNVANFNELLANFHSSKDLLTKAPNTAAKLYAKWQEFCEEFSNQNNLLVLKTYAKEVALIFEKINAKDQFTVEDCFELEKCYSLKNFVPFINQLKSEGKIVTLTGHYEDASFTKTYLNTNLKLGSEIKLVPYTGNTEIFIHPGHNVHLADYLVTNFHLPESTLIMLVSSITGKDFCLQGYHHAIANKYRFYSYGDSCFIPNLKNYSNLRYLLPI